MNPKYSPITADDNWFTGTKTIFEWTLLNAGDITGQHFEFVFKASKREQTKLLSKVSGAGLEISDAANAKVRVTIDAADTAGWHQLNGDYALWRTDSGQEQVEAFGEALIQESAAT